MKTTVAILQLIISILLMVTILMQNRGTSLSGLFGGSGGVYRTKRGMEKILFILTIIFAILFLGLSLTNLLLQS
jgi:preprotein translocase subunit SecG